MIANKKIRNDIILFLCIILVAVIAFLIYFLNLHKGENVVVKIDGVKEYTFSIQKDLTKKISTEYGENTIIISDKKVWIESADCPDKICERHNKISKTGETIICLPHKLVLEIEDRE